MLVTDLVAHLTQHSAWQDLLADPHSAGAVPSFDGLTCYRSDLPADVTALSGLGITIAGGVTRSDRVTFVWAAPEMPRVSFALKVAASNNNHVVIDCGAKLSGELGCNVGGSVFMCGASPGQSQTVRLTMRGPGNAFLFGENSSSYGARCAIEGPSRYIVVGRGSMFSDGITIKATDHHAIIDLLTGELVNPPLSVSIGPHVWLSADVMVLAGARIGAGSIIGARALVTSEIPERCLAVGTPARVIRNDVSWHRRDPSSLMGRRWKLDAAWQIQERE